MTYTIRDLEKITGIKTHTIRIWEQRYNLVEPKRTETNIRYYSDKDLKYLINVSLLNKTGHKISKIAVMNQSEIYEKVQSLALNGSSEEYYISELIKATLDMDELQAEKIISACINKMEFEETVESILFPFLKRLGFLWHTSSINVAQEHMLVNIIRRKIIVATDELISLVTPSLKPIVLFLPEWESHELGLLYCNYNLRKRGHKVYYLGSNMPVSELEQMAKQVNISYLIGFVTVNSSERKMTQFLNSYNSIEGIKKFISCRKDDKIKTLALDMEISFVENLEDLLDKI